MLQENGDIVMSFFEFLQVIIGFIAWPIILPVVLGFIAFFMLGTGFMIGLWPIALVVVAVLYNVFPGLFS